MTPVHMFSGIPTIDFVFAVPKVQAPYQLLCLEVPFLVLDYILNLSGSFMTPVHYLPHKAIGYSKLETILAATFYLLGVQMFWFWGAVLAVGGIEDQRLQSLLKDARWKDICPDWRVRCYELSRFEFRSAFRHLIQLPVFWTQVRDDYEDFVCWSVEQYLRNHAQL